MVDHICLWGKTLATKWAVWITFMEPVYMSCHPCFVFEAHAESSALTQKGRTQNLLILFWGNATEED